MFDSDRIIIFFDKKERKEKESEVRREERGSFALY